jgi:hypothetical protein
MEEQIQELLGCGYPNDWKDQQVAGQARIACTARLREPPLTNDRTALARGRLFGGRWVYISEESLSSKEHILSISNSGS